LHTFLQHQVLWEQFTSIDRIFPVFRPVSQRFSKVKAIKQEG